MEFLQTVDTGLSIVSVLTKTALAIFKWLKTRLLFKGKRSGHHGAVVRPAHDDLWDDEPRRFSPLSVSAVGFAEEVNRPVDSAPSAPPWDTMDRSENHF